jgi:hypothetical protein
MSSATKHNKHRSYSFHGHLEDELAYTSRRFSDTKETKYFIVQEREVSYRIYLHQHPYVQQLVQRLISRGGVSGLQAADTEYKSDGASLPGSIEIAISSNTGITVMTIPRGSKIVLLDRVHATTTTTSSGTQIELEANLGYKIANEVQSSMPEGMKATLVDGMTYTPPINTIFTLPTNSKAVLLGDTEITLSAGTIITLHDGTQASLTTETKVLLAENTEVTIHTGAQVKILKSKLLPVLFADVLSRYKPSTSLVQRPHPVKDLDFSLGGAYSIYNWELFFHIPITIAIHLSKNQRFAESQRWFHYLFDPTDDSEGPTPERFWKVQPFRATDVKKIEDVLANLATGNDETLRNETIRSMEAWKNAPFRPHVIARYRQQAYMYKTVTAYLDNLIAWGDSLFRQDTGEAIDEALMLYALAANILGPRPQPVPKKGSVRPQTYYNLRKDLKEFGTVMRDVESDLPFDLMPFPTDNTENDDNRLAAVRSLGKA